MTTIVTITNDGPDFASLTFYAENRTFKQELVMLKPGESRQITVWDGHVPVIQAHKHNSGDPPQFFNVPSAGFAYAAKKCIWCGKFPSEPERPCPSPDGDGHLYSQSDAGSEHGSGN